MSFYLIAHPMRPLERNRIGFPARKFETFCSQTPPPSPTLGKYCIEFYSIEVPCNRSFSVFT